MKITNKRIVDVYDEVSNDFYKNKENKNQKSKHWQSYYGFKKFNTENLINFRSSGIGAGLDDQTNSFTFKTYAEVVNQLSEEYVFSNLPKKNIGKSELLIKYKNIFLDYNKLIHIHWFNDVEKNVLKNNQISSICEIGGGFGSFSELFIKNYNTKLLSIDLPEACLMAAYYLKESFPEKKFYLYDDYKKNNYLSYEDFLNFDIIILPPNLNIDPKIEIDFFINARSMAEMNFITIKSYFEFIQKHVTENGFLLNINRYDKSSVGENIRISEYPYDGNWNVLCSKPAFSQPHIHFLLTQRDLSQECANLEKELLEIKKLEKVFYDKHVESIPFWGRAMVLYILKEIFSKKLLRFLGDFLLKIGSKLKKL